MHNPRKPIAMLLMLVLIAVYVVIIASLSGPVSQLPDWVQLPFYILAGVLWIVPLKPLFAWMNAVEPPEDD